MLPTEIMMNVQHPPMAQQIELWPIDKLVAYVNNPIAALLSQRNFEEAARTAGIGTTTLLRWLQMPEFDAAYRKARRDAFSQSIARLQQASGAAVSTLLKGHGGPSYAGFHPGKSCRLHIGSRG